MQILLRGFLDIDRTHLIQQLAGQLFKPFSFHAVLPGFPVNTGPIKDELEKHRQESSSWKSLQAVESPTKTFPKLTFHRARATSVRNPFRVDPHEAAPACCGHLCSQALGLREESPCLRFRRPEVAVMLKQHQATACMCAWDPSQQVPSRGLYWISTDKDLLACPFIG